jgi:hypothetical protein
MSEVSNALRNLIYALRDETGEDVPVVEIVLHPAVVKRLDREFDLLAYRVTHGSKTERHFMDVPIKERLP